jgi:hypothetical protein
MFTQPVSMRVSEKQFEEDLRQPLIDLGYRMRGLSDFSDMPIITTNVSGYNDVVSNVLEAYKNIHDRYFIDHYNPELFLALAAMTNKPSGIKGEWWKYVGNNVNRVFEKVKLYKQVKGHCEDVFAFSDDFGRTSGFSGQNCRFFVKPTKEEIINHFTNKPVMKKETRFPFRLNEKEYKQIIKVACGVWRQKLVAQWGVSIAIGGYADVFEDFYKEMRRACTGEQHNLFDEIFGKDEPVWTLADAKDGEPVWVKNHPSSTWHLRYANGRGETYEDQKKFGKNSTWPCAMPFESDNLPFCE